MNWDKLRHELLLENSEQDVIITREQYVNNVCVANPYVYLVLRGILFYMFNILQSIIKPFWHCSLC
jgi:hypothetical protein